MIAFDKVSMKFSERKKKNFLIRAYNFVDQISRIIVEDIQDSTKSNKDFDSLTKISFAKFTSYVKKNFE